MDENIKKIKIALMEKKMSQKSLGQQLNFTGSMINALLHGKRSLSEETLESIEKILEIKLDRNLMPCTLKKTYYLMKEDQEE